MRVAAGMWEVPTGLLAPARESIGGASRVGWSSQLFSND